MTGAVLCLLMMASGCAGSDEAQPAPLASSITTLSMEATTTAPSPSTLEPEVEPARGSLDEDSSYVIEDLLGTTVTDLGPIEALPCEDGFERETGPFEPEIAGDTIRSRPIVDGTVQRTSYFTRCEVVDGSEARVATLFFYEEPVVTSGAASDTSPDGSTETDDATEAAIAADFNVVVSSYNVCLEQLPKCDVAGPSAWRTGTQLAEIQSQVATWNASGYFVSEVETRTQTLLAIDLESDISAQIRTCEYDASTLMQAADATTGRSEQVIDGDEISITQTWVLEFEEGKWKAADIIDRVATLNGGNKCA